MGRDGYENADVAPHLPLVQLRRFLEGVIGEERLYDPEGPLRAIGELTKHGGTFLMTRTVTPLAHMVTFPVAETHSGHPSMKRPEDWVRILKENGFKTVEVRTFSSLPIPPAIFDRYFTVDCKASLASHVRIVAQKD